MTTCHVCHRLFVPQGAVPRYACPGLHAWRSTAAKATMSEEQWAQVAEQQEWEQNSFLWPKERREYVIDC